MNVLAYVRDNKCNTLGAGYKKIWRSKTSRKLERRFTQEGSRVCKKSCTKATVQNLKDTGTVWIGLEANATATATKTLII